MPAGRSSLEYTLQLIFASIQSHNARLVQSLLSSAWTACTLAYEAAMRATISANPYHPLAVNDRSDADGSGSDSLAYLQASCAVDVPAGARAIPPAPSCEACRVRDAGALPCVREYLAAGHDRAVRAGREKFVTAVVAGDMPWLGPGQLSYETMLASCEKKGETTRWELEVSKNWPWALLFYFLVLVTMNKTGRMLWVDSILSGTQ